jgi:hypothetical protein
VSMNVCLRPSGLIMEWTTSKSNRGLSFYA